MSAARRWGGVVLGLAVLGAGCDGQDVDRLSRVGKRVAEKASAWTAEQELPARWRALRSGGEELPLEARVQARLRWDKGLADSLIEVHAAGPAVELRGQVQDEEQRQRAIELAESTAGVENVTDQLTLKGEETKGP